MTPDLPSELDHLLHQAIRQFDWKTIYDYHRGGYLTRPPHLDLALVVFPPAAEPVYGNILLSPDLPNGHRVDLTPDSLQTQEIRWLQDPGDWDQCVKQAAQPNILWDPGQTTQAFISPYPASVFKLMVGIGILRLRDQEALDLNTVWDYRGDPTDSGHTFESGSIQDWLERMLWLSDDRATCALIQLLHQCGILSPAPDHRLNHLFQTLGLATLQINSTRPGDGSFLNRAGSGVGQIHMTAWDSARLLWLLDPKAPSPGWIRPNGTQVEPDHLLSTGSRRFLVEHLMAQQAFHDCLSTTILCGFSGIAPGIPSRLPHRWIAADGSVTLQDNQAVQPYSRNVMPCQQRATVTFAHKSGLTTHYGSNVGIVNGIPELGHHRHYLIALLTNLGYRYTSTPQPGDPHYASGFQRLVWYPQQIPALGAFLDRGIQALVGP